MQGSSLKIPPEKVPAHRDAERVLMWGSANWAFTEQDPQSHVPSLCHTNSQLAVGQWMQGSHSSFWILSVFRKVLMCTAWLTGIFAMCNPLDLFRRQLNTHGMVRTVYKYMCGPEEHKQTGCWHLKKQPLDYRAAASGCTHSSSSTGAGTLNICCCWWWTPNKCLCTPIAKIGCPRALSSSPSVLLMLCRNLGVGVCV